MCDQKLMAAMLERQRRGELSRREFGALAAGAGLALLAPELLAAAGVVETEVEIKTADGTVDAYFAHPSQGQHPGVLIWPDAFGLRPAFQQMGRRLAAAGYAVLVVNPYYRLKKAPAFGADASFEDEATLNELDRLSQSLSAEHAALDARACCAFLDRQPAVATQRKLATVGYCMGGAFTMRTAAAVPERVGAGAAFHATGLASARPTSPHLLIPKMKARYLVAIAEGDDEADPAAKDLLRSAFAQAGLPARIEVYAGASHGWCPPDSPVYSHAHAERAWTSMLELFKTALA